MKTPGKAPAAKVPGGKKLPPKPPFGKKTPTAMKAPEDAAPAQVARKARLKDVQL